MKRLIILLLMCAWSTSSSAAPIKVACVGDSITLGYGVASAYSYPARLQALLGSNYQVRNFGAVGTTAIRMERSYMDRTPFLPQISAWKPDIVVIMLGTNDPWFWNLEMFDTGYRQLIGTFLSYAKKPKIVLCTPAYAYFPGNPGELVNTNIRNQVLAIYDSYDSKSFKLVDINTITKNMSQNFPDTVHPNINGYYIIAISIYQAIKGEKGWSGEIEAPAGPANSPYGIGPANTYGKNDYWRSTLPAKQNDPAPTQKSLWPTKRKDTN